MSEFDEGFREIQDVFRKYHPLSILKESLGYLYAPAKSKADRTTRQPWLVMLLIKWVFLDVLANSPIRRPFISQGGLLELLQKVLNLTDSDKMPNEYEDVRLFFRAVAYQQFFYQAEGKLVDVARQEAIFAKVPSNHYFKTRFLKGTGLSVEAFLRLSFALLAGVDKYGMVLSRDYLFALCPPYTPMEVDAYLRAVSIDANELHKALMAADIDGRGPSEFLQQTPFLRFPLVKVGDQYWCVSPHVLNRSLGHFVYDYLKRDDVNSFNSPFGKSFEGYVGKWLRKSKLLMADEKELISELPGKGGVVDFLVADGESNVLIDAKGVEMAQGGMAAVRKGDIRRATKTSLLKAFEQGHEVVSRLPSVCGKNPVICQRSVNYLLAVTYKELYIGNGLTLAGVVGDAELDKIRNKYASEYQIPIENIYFLTIHEFEDLMDMVGSGKTGLVEFLERAKLADAHPETQKFTFEMHIQDLTRHVGRNIPLIDVLKEMRDELCRTVPALARK
ncbi:GapS1 family protein [Pseudomonas fluorescens]|uniref:GapS1 family protein n=1 Tax=Pseudomonas fluorescens TaxID=294 RepID=UPI003D1CF7D6